MPANETWLNCAPEGCDDALFVRSPNAHCLAQILLTEGLEIGLCSRKDGITAAVQKIIRRFLAVICAYGGRGRIRTRDSRLRRPVPYPG